MNPASVFFWLSSHLAWQAGICKHAAQSQNDAVMHLVRVLVSAAVIGMHLYSFPFIQVAVSHYLQSVIPNAAQRPPDCFVTQSGLSVKNRKSSMSTVSNYSTACFTCVKTQPSTRCTMANKDERFVLTNTSLLQVTRCL